MYSIIDGVGMDGWMDGWDGHGALMMIRRALGSAERDDDKDEKCFTRDGLETGDLYDLQRTAMMWSPKWLFDRNSTGRECVGGANRDFP